MAYKPFKMKGKSTIQGTDTHKKEIKTYKELKVNRDLEHNMPDGRSMSSPFQKKKDDDINELIEKRSDLKEKKEKLDQVQTELKNEMADSEILEDSSGFQVCTWKSSSTTRLDTKKLLQERPELKDEFPSVSTSRTFRLKRRRDDEYYNFRFHY